MSDQFITKLLENAMVFWDSMMATGLSEAKGWKYTQDLVERFFSDLETTKADLGEEDIDSGMVWASMCGLMKIQEYSRARFVEHPSVSSMLIHSLLERKNGEEAKDVEAFLANSALSQAADLMSEILCLTDLVTANHKEATDALNQVKQLKDKVNHKEKGDGTKGS